MLGMPQVTVIYVDTYPIYQHRAIPTTRGVPVFPRNVGDASGRSPDIGPHVGYPPPASWSCGDAWPVMEEYKSAGKYKYLPGFGNHFCSEAVEGALPQVRSGKTTGPHHKHLRLMDRRRV